MKNIFLLAVYLFSSSTVFCQFVDSFSDGNFTYLPTWSGDDGNFIITADAEQQLQLQGDCAAGGDNYLSAAAPTKDSASWSFFVHLDFDPSSGNYAKIYLQSDQADLSASLNGYYIKIGEDGASDVVRLYRQEGATSTLVCSGTSIIATAPSIGIKVLRTNSAEWQLYIDPTGGITYTLEASTTDAEINGGSYMGVYCKYTSTRCTLFYFDNFFADPLYTDTDAPELVSASPIASNQLLVDFNEDVDITSSQFISNYTVDDGVGNPINAVRDVSDHSKVILTFASDFPFAELLTLTVMAVTDEAGNTLGSETTTFFYYTPQPFDIVIDELLADPDPVVALPDVEYLELYNTSPIDIDISGFYITDATSASDPFPAATLAAHAYIIVCDDANTALFTPYGNTIGIANFPSLNNDGDNISLISPTGLFLHTVNYTSDWYDNAIKAGGGYALEMIDPENPCQGDENWTASNAADGGTPGALNSVNASNPDETAPVLTGAFTDGDTIFIYLDEAIDIYSADVSNFTIDNGIGQPNQVFTNQAGIIKLTTTSPLSIGIIYTVVVTGVADCSGNVVSGDNSAQFAIPQPADAQDLVINEVLFNPATSGSDYVELYNRSDKIIDLSTLILAEWQVDDTTDITESTYITNEGHLLFPGQYALITADITSTAQAYFPPSTTNFIENTNTPNYPDDEGIVVLYSNTLQVLDVLHYYNDWHFALLGDENGVSLERVNYDFATQNANNWHSAAQDVHFGTPGYQNSDFGATETGGAVVVLDYDILSPNGDGYHDLLIVRYNTPTDGYSANFDIYDVSGRKIKTLDNNGTLSREGFVTWDGVSDAGLSVSSGIYILYAELFTLNGAVEKYKLKFTLSKN